MAPNARDKDNRSAEEAALSARLQRLGERLGQKRASMPSEDVTAPQSGSHSEGLARGIRLSSELVAGVLVGALFGWSLDHWLGSSPWGMIVFLLIGFAAGVLNLLRSVGVMPEQGADDRKG